MDIDLVLLRALEREKDISFDILIDALEQALLTAYRRPPGAQARARVRLDRKTGRVTVFARGRRGRRGPAEYDDTPEGFGRIAAATAKQVILQRLRDAEDDVKFGEFSGREGDMVSGTDPAGPQPRGRPGRPRPARGSSRRSAPGRCPGSRRRTSPAPGIDAVRASTAAVVRQRRVERVEEAVFAVERSP